MMTSPFKIESSRDLTSLELMMLEGFECVPGAPGDCILFGLTYDYNATAKKALLRLLCNGLVDVNDGWARASLKGEQYLVHARASGREMLFPRSINDPRPIG